MNPVATVAAQRIRDNLLDSEYGLDISDEEQESHERKHFSLKELRGGHEKIDILHPDDVKIAAGPPSPCERMYSRQESARVLLAARTEHFGGDLVTQEHQSRELVNSLANQRFKFKHFARLGDIGHS